mmetsp:Transcript_19829/g.63795  ORF Transcript_19829/g.63795 Transcript_19829/m.63795 type:complete len:138 (+) Transcript_19829:4874-5287(+)
MSLSSDNGGAPVVYETTQNDLVSYPGYAELHKYFEREEKSSGFAYDQQVEGVPILHPYLLLLQNVDTWHPRPPFPERSPGGATRSDTRRLESTKPSGRGSMTAARYADAFCEEAAAALAPRIIEARTAWEGASRPES